MRVKRKEKLSSEEILQPQGFYSEGQRKVRVQPKNQLLTPKFMSFQFIIKHRASSLICIILVNIIYKIQLRQPCVFFLWKREEFGFTFPFFQVRILIDANSIILIILTRQMSQIRRQPRRKTKKSALKTIKNPFQQCLAYLPMPMAKKIQHLEKIIVRHLDELVTEPQTDMNENLFLIKQALKRQETLVNELKDQRERESKKSQTPSTEEHIQVDASAAENQMEDFMMLEHPIDFQFWRSHEDSGLNFFGLQ